MFIFQSRCHDLVCYMNVTYLDPCTFHTFTLTPHYKSTDGVETQGSELYTDAFTLGPGEAAVHENTFVNHVPFTLNSVSALVNKRN